MPPLRSFFLHAIVLSCLVAFAPVGATPPDSCALMRKADVDGVFSPRSFDSGTAGPSQPGTAKLAAVAVCTYTSQAPRPRDIVSVTLMVRRSPDGVKQVPMAAAKAGAVQLKATPVDVPGLGNGAYWINMGTDVAPSYQLNVMVGARYWLVFSTSGVTLEPPQAVQALTTLAKAVLPRLN